MHGKLGKASFPSSWELGCRTMDDMLIIFNVRPWIQMNTIDLETGKLDDEWKTIWNGTGGMVCRSNPIISYSEHF